jgi:hypothetical protein
MGAEHHAYTSVFPLLSATCRHLVVPGSACTWTYTNYLKVRLGSVQRINFHDCLECYRPLVRTLVHPTQRSNDILFLARPTLP